MTDPDVPSPTGWTTALDTRAETSRLATDASRVFDDPDSVWFILEGGIDLFAVHREKGQQTGPRQHLCALSPGALVWGIRQSATKDGFHLLAVARDDTRLCRFGTAIAAELGSNPETAPIMAKAVDQWIMALSQGVTKHIKPRRQPDLFIADGEAATLYEDQRTTTRKEVVWVELLDGPARYIDIREIVPSEGSPTLLPITPHSWLREGGGREIRGHSTERLMADGDFARHMDLFHESVINLLAYDFRNAGFAEKARLDRRTSFVAAETERILTRFMGLFHSDHSFRRSIQGDDSLFESCSLVAASLDLSLVMPPWSKRRRAEDRPLDIHDIAAASRLRVRQVTLNGEWWNEDSGPLVGFIEDGHRPVALLPQPGLRYVVHDPVSGTEQTVTPPVAAALSPMAYVLYPALPDGTVSAFELLKFGLGRCRGDLAALALTGALGGLVATTLPLATGYVFDSIVPGHQVLQMIQIGLALLVVAFSAAIFHFANSVALLRIEGKLSGLLQAALMDRLLRLPLTFFSSYSSGDLAQRTMMVEAIRKSLTGVVLGSLVSGVFSLFNFALLFYYFPIAAGIALLLLLFLCGIVIFAAMRQMSAVLGSEEVAGKISGRILELITGITKLRLAGAEERAFNLWGRDFLDLCRFQIRYRSIENGYAIFWSGYEILALAAIFAVIAHVGGDRLSTGGFLAFVAAFTAFLSSFGTLAESVMSVFAVMPLYERAAPILKEPTENNLRKSDPGILTGALEINGVTFRYAPDLPRTLNGLSIRADAGEFIAVVGPSGSGKSTVMRLLLGFERPETGGVFFDGRDLRGLDLQLVRRQIGVVLQNSHLMPGSIYENIQGATRATLDECWNAATMAKIDEDIRSMAMGMHTVLTEGGSSLSQGQIQRILLARAIVGKPKLLLLDEATSALDNITQSGVSESLDGLSSTRVVIAHRLSTVIRANRIYVLDAGHVVECGTYDQLMDENGLFAELARRQQL